MGQQLQMLRENIHEVLGRCGQITRNIITADTTAKGSMDDIMKAEEAIERAESALKAAENYIDVEGQAALQRAKSALDRFGQQSSQMTQIATEAKEMSMRQLEEAKRVEMLAKKALETSNEALQLAMDTLQVKNWLNPCPGPEFIKLFMLIWTEHEIYHAHNSCRLSSVPSFS